ncbi:biopolymer transporter Tol [Candidatus Magnetomorum sp. HK-1]|nr:biopolymer transporter Tol [Candidatus Magnetomorum sp. HK-1]
MKHSFSIFTLLLCVLVPEFIFAFPSNSWKHMRSKHFTISYSEKTEQIASKALDIAEEAAAVIGEYFGSDISKFHRAIVLKDHNDYYNGNASRYIPLVNIDCRKTDAFYRNDTHWLKKVLSHELSHIYTLRIMQLPTILQLGAASEYDDDGKHAFFTYRHNSLPLWFVEGIAQLGSYQCKSDYRDPFREMLLRDAFHNGLLLSLKEMQRFEGSSREYELVYNQGFDFLLYLIETYPLVSMKTLCQKIKYAHMTDVFKASYKKSIPVLYNEWKMSLKNRFSKQNEILDGKPLYNRQNRILTTEIASVDNGKYAITNWLHDYNQFDLFILSDKSKIQKVIKDSGQILRHDQGNIYFTKEVYNRETGAVNYDIFMINPLNNLKQLTHNKRCMAFDVRENHIILGAYKNGKTSILLKKPDQSIQNLIEFSRKTSVYNISMISNDSAVLSLSENKKRTMGIFKNFSMERPWEKLNIDVFDIIYAEKGRYVFVSTIDGTPQLYWCHLETDKNIWYKITSVAGGARYPNFDRKTNQLSCSIYAKGNHKLYLLNNPFRKDLVIDIKAYYDPDNVVVENSKSHQVSLKKKVFANTVLHSPVLSVLFDTEKENLTSENFYEMSKNIISPGIKLYAKNAPSNLELSLYSAMNVPLGYNTKAESFPTFDLTLKYDIQKVRLWGEFNIDSSLREYRFYDRLYDGMVDFLEKQKISSYAAMASYQLFKDDFISLRIENINRNIQSKYKFNKSPFFSSAFTYEGPEEKVYTGLINSLSWHHQTNTHRFDPAGLGNPYFEILAVASVFVNKNYEIGLFNPQYYDLENSSIFKLLYGLSLRNMYFFNKLSAKYTLDGFIYFGEKESHKISPFMYEMFGREGLFSGYPYDIKGSELHRISGEFKFNPFLSINDGIRWYERMNCGIKIEAGYSKYFDTDYKTIYPVSCEMSFRYGFYFWPDRKGTAYIKYARPLKSIDDISDTSSYRIYVGLSI